MEADPGADRAGRLADDRLHDAGRPSRSTAAPTSRRPRGTGCRRSGSCSSGGADLARAPRRGRRGRPADRRRPRRAVGARRRRAPRPPARRTSTPAVRGARRDVRPRSAAGSAARRSSRRRWCWSSCCATTPAPVTRRRCRWPRRPARRWPAAASTTSSAAASRATPSTRAGWCRTSRRCSTTTRCCCGSTRTCGGRPAPSWPAGWRWRPPTSWCASCAPRRAASPPRSTPTPTGVEGAHYVWTPAQLAEVLGEDDGAWAARALRGHRGGHLRARRVGAAAAAPTPTTPDALGRRCGRGCSRRATSGRQPARDDKVVAAWNGLAIAALAETGALLRPAGPGRARRPRRPTCCVRRAHGRRAGCAGRRGTAWSGAHAGVLEDYADVAEGFLALLAVTGDGRWLDLAGVLLDIVLDQFGDDDGGFYDTADDAEPRWLDAPAAGPDGQRHPRPAGRPPPARCSAYAAVHRVAASTAAAAEGALGVVTALAAARAVHRLGARRRRGAARRAARGRRRRAAGRPGHRRAAPYGAARHRPGCRGRRGRAGRPTAFPLLADRPLVGGQPAAYVCRHFVCDAPTTDPAALAATLGARMQV